MVRQKGEDNETRTIEEEEEEGGGDEKQTRLLPKGRRKFPSPPAPLITERQSDG